MTGSSTAQRDPHPPVSLRMQVIRIEWSLMFLMVNYEPRTRCRSPHRMLRTALTGTDILRDPRFRRIRRNFMGVPIKRIRRKWVTILNKQSRSRGRDRSRHPMFQPRGRPGAILFCRVHNNISNRSNCLGLNTVMIGCIGLERLKN